MAIMDIKNAKVIDLSKVKNCWIVQMLPFTTDDRKNNNLVNDYQNFCYTEKIFGIGWSDDYDKNKNKMKRLENIFDKVTTKHGELNKKTEKELYEKIINICNKELKDIKNIQDIYQTVYNTINSNTNKENNGLKIAINSFFSIEKGDIVITRLRDGSYLIGQVNDEEKFFKKIKGEKEKVEKHESNGFSWKCKVDEWIKLQRNEVPSDIIGIFSQRNQRTISKSNERIKLLALKLYQEKRKEQKSEDNIEIPAIVLSERNFGRSLNPDELEDLVYLYILDKEEKDNNKNLILLPSHCKISEPMYEFYLKDKNNINEKSITCQVKNIDKVEYSDYLKQKELFKKIYLFSGINDYGNDAEKDDKVVEISTKELYDFLTDNKKYFSFLNNKNYYNFEKNDNETENNKSNTKNNSEKTKPYFRVGNKKIEYRKKGQRFKNKYEIIYYKDENDGKIQKIDFGDFHYNNEFKCFIIDNNVQDSQKIIEAMKLNEENNKIFKDIL